MHGHKSAEYHHISVPACTCLTQLHCVSLFHAPGAGIQTILIMPDETGLVITFFHLRVKEISERERERDNTGSEQISLPS